MIISIIAAVAENGVIGNGGEIPWYLPSDFAFFKKTTMGKPIIMGRKTFQSIGKSLPGRANIVISQNKDFAAKKNDDIILVNSLEQAIRKAKIIAQKNKQNEIMIIGGAQIYQQAMKHADRLYISHVFLAPKGDSFFPKIDKNIWRVEKEIEFEKSRRDSAQYKLLQYARNY